MNVQEHFNVGPGLGWRVAALVGGLMGAMGLLRNGVSGFIVLPMAAILIAAFTIVVMRDKRNRREQANRAASERH